MKKFIEFVKKYKVELLSFIIPVIIFLLGLVFTKVFPFGDKYIAAYDSGSQYSGFTNLFINVLKGKASLFYTFKGGLGYNFYATCIYYLFNPTNLLSIFFNESNIMLYYTFIVLLRIGLSGLTMSIYLKDKEKNNGRLLFSIAYSLMAYNLLYFYNFMYFDTIVLLPLVIKGLDKLINKEKPTLYIVMLTISIISNYYIGSMVCIFSLLYFIYKYILLDKNNRKGIIKTFIFSSLLCGLMSAIVILPEYFELMRGKVILYSQDYTKYNEWGWDFIAAFYRLSIGGYNARDQINGYPNIYCSLLVLCYTILFFFNKKYSKKEKIATLTFILFFLLCFSFNMLDYAWQFFQKPCWYPNRYSFVFSFLLIIIGYESYNNKENIKINDRLLFVVAAALMMLIIGAAFVNKISIQDTSKFIFLFLSIICVVEYMFSYKVNNAKVLITSIFLLEIIANTFSGLKQINFSKTFDSYDKPFSQMNEAFNYIEGIDPIKNNFYRLDSYTWINANNPGIFNYNGFYIFDSLRNGKLMYFLEHYSGYEVHDECSTRFNYKNPIYNALLGFKYVVSTVNINYYEKIKELSFNSKLSTGLYEETKYSIYKNDDALSLGFMMNENIKNIKFEDKSYFDNANSIVTLSTIQNLNIFKELKYDELINYTIEDDKLIYDSFNGGKVIFKGVADKDSFIVLNPNMNNGAITLKINNEVIEGFNANAFTPFIIKKGQSYYIEYSTSVKKTDIKNLTFYLIDINGYKKWISEMKKNELEITKYEKDSYIKGKINVTNDKKVLFTSIPYDDGWKVYVDGKKTNYYEILTAFIGLDLSKGEHTIEFKYVPKGFILGLTISLISLVSSILYIKKIKLVK